MIGKSYFQMKNLSRYSWPPLELATKPQMEQFMVSLSMSIVRCDFTFQLIQLGVKFDPKSILKNIY